MLEHPKEGREMGLRGQGYALRHHNTEKLVSNMDGLYRTLLREMDDELERGTENSQRKVS